MQSGASTPCERSFTTRAHLLRLVLPLGERHADVQHVRAALHLLARDLQHPVVVVVQQVAASPCGSPCALTRSPIIVGAGICTRSVGADARRRRGARTATSRGLRLRARRRAPPARRRCSGVVPQHPPTTFTPNSRDELLELVGEGHGAAAGRRRSPASLCGMPALGITEIGQARALAEEAHRLRACAPGRWSSSGRCTSTPQRLQGGHRRRRRRCPAACARRCRASPAPAAPRAGRPPRIASPTAEDGRLHLEDVLRGLDQQHVHPALHQRPRPARRRPAPARRR